MRLNKQELVNIGSLGAAIIAVTAILPMGLAQADDVPPPALIDNRDGTYIVYPDVLPECDEEDGTATHNGSPVAACNWNDGTGHRFIVISPLP